jgi:hypothetical protein
VLESAVGEGYDEQTRRTFVESVDNARALSVANRKVGVPSHQRVRKGIVRVAGRRVDDEAGWFIDHHEVRTFVDYVKGDRRGHNSHRRRGRQLDFDGLARANPFGRANGPPIDGDVLIHDQPLNLRPGELRKLVAKKTIKPLTARRGRDGKGPAIHAGSGTSSRRSLVSSDVKLR